MPQRRVEDSLKTRPRRPPARTAAPALKLSEFAVEVAVRRRILTDPMANPTLRTLARTLGLSRTTISDALRGSPRVNAKTAERVRVAAKAAGYESNPLTGTVMSLLRRSRSQEFRGVLAAIEIVDGAQPAHAIRYNERVLAGVSERASALAFKVDRFEISPAGLRLSRLDAILQARGIHAMVILPASGFPDLAGLDWQRYTAVYIDYLIDHPPLHCVCSDHYHSMISLLQELYRRGYRRPGLFMEITHDERLHFRWEGAFLALQKYLPNIAAVPTLRLQTVTRARFEPWFRKYDPDVVLGHVAEAMDWMRACGARIPETHAFVCLNSLRTDSNCAALDLQASHLGARAAELVIGQLLHNELGVPAEPSLTTIPAKLVEGPTLRGPVAAPGPLTAAS
jgi:DNA-binding LacI/PurR family transcriptional regulator